MRLLLRLVAALTFIATSAFAQSFPAPKTGEWIAKDFKFHTGETLAEVKLAYTTIGDPKGEPVLILHGMADDNVTFDHTTRVLFALQAAGTPFETMVYPGLRHRGGWTPTNRKHRAMQTLDFFDRKLK